MEELPMKISGKGRACGAVTSPLEMAARTLRHVKVQRFSRVLSEGCAADMTTLIGQT